MLLAVTQTTEPDELEGNCLRPEMLDIFSSRLRAKALVLLASLRTVVECHAGEDGVPENAPWGRTATPNALPSLKKWPRDLPRRARVSEWCFNLLVWAGSQGV